MVNRADIISTSKDILLLLAFKLSAMEGYDGGLGFIKLLSLIQHFQPVPFEFICRSSARVKNIMRGLLKLKKPVPAFLVSQRQMGEGN